MNFRTIIMLAIAALVIIVAVKMNRNSVAEPEALPTEQTETAPADDATEGGVMTEEEANDLIYDDMDGTVEAPNAPEAGTDEAEVPAGDQPSGETVDDVPAGEVSEEPAVPAEPAAE